MLVGWPQRHPASPKSHCNQGVGEKHHSRPHTPGMAPSNPTAVGVGKHHSRPRTPGTAPPPRCASVSPPGCGAPPPTTTPRASATLCKWGGGVGGVFRCPGGGQAVNFPPSLGPAGLK